MPKRAVFTNWESGVAGTAQFRYKMALSSPWRETLDGSPYLMIVQLLFKANKKDQLLKS